MAKTNGDQARLQEKNAKGIFARTYQCNKCLVSMSYCQQDILVHKASLNALDVLIKTGLLKQPYCERKYAQTSLRQASGLNQFAELCIEAPKEHRDTEIGLGGFPDEIRSSERAPRSNAESRKCKPALRSGEEHVN
jgi:hypothetical protein